MNRSRNRHSPALAKAIRVALAAVLLSAASAMNVRANQTEISSLGNLPLLFQSADANSDAIQFVARGRQCGFSIAPTSAILSLTKSQPASESQTRLGRVGAQSRAWVTRQLRFEFLSANPRATVSAAGKVSGAANYFIGKDPTQWRTGVGLFERVCVDEIYPGVDLVYYGNEQRLEYDFVVAPGTNPNSIQIRFSGADRVRVAEDGDLVFTLGDEELRQPKPVVYQSTGDERKTIRGGYRLIGADTVGFDIAEYNRELPLVIDPILSYSTYYGGTGLDAGWSVKVDTNGFVYVAGETMGGLPVSPEAPQNSFNGPKVLHGDAFVAKFDNAASRVEYLAYIGGKGHDVALDLALDAEGNAYITGYTDSTNFPTENALFPNISGNAYPGTKTYPIDAFVTKLGDMGTNLIYSTYLGGAWVDEGVGIALDSTGGVFITGYTESTNFPATNVSTLTNYNGGGDAFVAHIDPSGTNLVYALYLGGTNLDAGSGIAVSDDTGAAHVTGYTRSTNFPVVMATQSALGGELDAFVTVINPNTTDDVTNWLRSTFWGGPSGNFGSRIALDADGNSYIVGTTTADPSFPVTPSALNPGGIVRTGDGGTNWIDANAGLDSIVVPAIAVDPSNPANIYAATWRGLFRSTDAGASWHRDYVAENSVTGLAPVIANSVVLSIAIDSGAPSTIYAGTESSGVFKSVDSGATWFLSNAGIANLAINALAVNAANPSIVYAGTEAGIYRSFNGGTNWSAATSGLGSLRVQALAATSTALFAGTASNGVYRSVNGATNWSSVNTGLTNHFVNALAADPANEQIIFAGTAGGLFKTINRGTNWFYLSTGSTNKFNIAALAIDPMNPSTIYIGATNGVFVSYDGGTNWLALTNGLPISNVLSLAINPADPQAVYVGLRGAVTFGGEDAFISKFGANGYSVVFGGSSNDEGWDIAVDAGRAHVVGATFSTNFPVADASGFLRATNAGGADAFVTQLSAAGDALNYSVLFGGTKDDRGYGIALDAIGNAYFVGETASANLPTLTPGQPAFGGDRDAFLAKLMTGTPMLNISQAGTNVVLSWTILASEFVLQRNASVTNAAGWADYFPTRVETNGMQTVTIPDSSGAFFYRLRNPH